MYEYKFTYRRITGECHHCRKLKNRSKLKKLIDLIFRSRKLKEEAEKVCEFEWKSPVVIGHGLEKIDENAVDTGTMVIYFKDGSLQTIKGWPTCEVKLGTDWVLSTKKQMEAESGQNVKLNMDTN